MIAEPQNLSATGYPGGSSQPAPNRRSNRVLDPLQRISEVLFGLIMVLTFTGSFAAVTADQASVRALMAAALGCNLAWGIIDAGMYLMACLHEQGRKLVLLRTFRAARDPAAAQGVLAEALPPLLVPLLPAEQVRMIWQKLRQLPEPAAHPRPTRNDWLGAVGVFLLVFVSTFPVIIPFMLITDPKLALRISHAIAVAMLFLCGYAYGRETGLPPLAVGGSMVIIGLMLVALAILLGG